MTIMVLASHSDDSTLGCGGIILKYVAEGEEVISVCFSKGESILGNPQLTDKLGHARREEAMNVDKFLGCKGTHFLNFPDTQLQQYLAEKRNKNLVLQIINEHKPTIIFTHCVDDPHPDHRAVAQLVQDLRDKISAQVYSFIISLPLKFVGSNKPRIYIDVSNYYEKKIEALKKFKSQRRWMYFYANITRILNRLAGIRIGAKYAEMFYVM